MKSRTPRRHRETLRLLATIVALGALVVALSAFRQTITLPNGEQGVIDWSAGKLSATGLAVPPSNASTAAQGEVLARRGAILDAQRSLVEVIRGLHLTAETTMVNAMANDVVRSHVEGAVQGAVITDSSWDGKIYHVTMEIPLATVRTVLPPVAVTPKPTQTPAPATVNTGLIVDARGLDITPALYVNVFDENGNAILNGLSAIYDPSLPANTTLPNPIDQAKHSPGVGGDPLVVTPTGVAHNRIDIVLGKTAADALRKDIAGGAKFTASNSIIIAN